MAPGHSSRAVLCDQGVTPASLNNGVSNNETQKQLHILSHVQYVPRMLTFALLQSYCPFFKVEGNRSSCSGLKS